MARGKSKGIGLTAEICHPIHRPSRADMERERRWRAESDLRTLREAEQIRADRSRVNMAQKVAQEEVRALSRIAGKSKPK